MKSGQVCRVFAHACSMAVVIDAAVPRPGLSSFEKPRKDLDPVSFAALSPIAYETCLCSCHEGVAAAHRGENSWCKCWFRAIRAMRRWGNPGLGSLLLLALQGAGLGYSYEKLGSIKAEHIAGSANILVESAGPTCSKYFYDALYMLRPSYLGRIYWSGLPDATQRQHQIGLELGDLLRAAALYDNVSRDAIYFFEASFGIALRVLRDNPCLREGVKKATYVLAASYADFLLMRKLGEDLRELWGRALSGDRESENELWKKLGEIGPGSIADLVVNALARRLFEAILLGDNVTLLC